MQFFLMATKKEKKHNERINPSRERKFLKMVLNLEDPLAEQRNRSGQLSP